MVLQLLVPVLVDLYFILEGGDDELRVLLEVLQLVHQFLVLLLRKGAQVVVDAQVLHSRDEFSHFPFAGALEHHPVYQSQNIYLKVDVREAKTVKEVGIRTLVNASGRVDGGLVDALEGALHALAEADEDAEGLLLDFDALVVGQVEELADEVGALTEEVDAREVDEGVGEGLEGGLDDEGVGALHQVHHLGNALQSDEFLDEHI